MVARIRNHILRRRKSDIGFTHHKESYFDMKQWATKSTDTKRVKLLKNVAANLNDEILSSANQPIKGVEELRNQWKAADIARLNARIKLAGGKPGQGTTD